MADAPFDNTGSRNDEPVPPGADILETDGSSSGRHTGKKSAFRNFFKHSPSNHDSATPRSGGVSARAMSSAHNATVFGEEDFEDHMLGSVYKPTDICKACGFPRGSSVCCPVTRRHHGTDEEMTPSKHHHSRSSSGGMNIIAKIRGKLPLTPRRRNGNNEDEAEQHSPETGELPPLTLTANSGPHGEDGAKQTPLFRNNTMSPPQPQFDGEDAEGNEHDNPASLDAYVSNESPAQEAVEETQYYCYTDENGDTYYYTQELREPAHDATQAMQDPLHAEGEGAAATAAAANAADDTRTDLGDLPEGTYVYQYVDENGETVNCLCTPPAGGDSPAADHNDSEAEAEGEAAAADRATTATSAVAHAGSDTANSSETDEPSAHRKKPATSFFTAIQNVFKPRRGSHPDRQHEDTLNMGDSSTSAQTPPSSAGLDGTTNSNLAVRQGCVEAHEYDAAVTTFMELLDAGEKKKFLKERKNLIKELATSEKKERETIMKNRHDGMAAFTRDKLTIAFSIRKDERTIKTGRRKGEPI
ncbi:hypothetical protein NQL31_001854 [Lotmaria passim]